MPKAKSPPAHQPEKDRIPDPDEPSCTLHFPVAGIGASAGGLRAIEALLCAMPGDLGMAFVLVPHLDPTHASLLVELLRPRTQMPVHEVRDGVHVQPDTIYVIPPNHALEMHGGRLRLSPSAAPHPGNAPPIDRFFRSLAEDQREAAIGILLSGTGPYGTLGFQAIKANGGMTMVQDPAEAEFDQMPASAVSAGVADYVLRVAKMPEALRTYCRHSYVTSATRPSGTGLDSSHLSRILTLLQAHTKYKFNDYRKKMLMRRIQRRMSLNHIEDPNGYVKLLRKNEGECIRLIQDFLISVSSFFRDPEAYAVLERKVIPDLIERKAGGDVPIRIWVAGCGSGEEAYSIGMLFLEAMAKAKSLLSFQIFATDINEAALKSARLGVYPNSIAADLSPERLQRFFTKSGNHYTVNKQLRETVMFAAQNVIGDVSFSRLDLISCRNLLIYLEPEVQRKVVALFHFALNKDGYLFLGASETVGMQTDLFDVISKKWRIFKRTGPSRPDRVEFPIEGTRSLHSPALAPHSPSARAAKIDLLAQHVLLSNYAPACVIVNRTFEILYVYGPVNEYIRVPPGRPTHDLLAMAHKGLRARIRALCRQAKSSHDGEISGDAHVKRDGDYSQIRIKVKEIREPKELEGLLLVSFEDLPEESKTTSVEITESGRETPLVQQLQFELKTTREELQSTIDELKNSNEELQDANEELKTSNEEMMSMNEELQSVNEELETSKEELQSLNEELNTVNNQLEEKIEELDEATNDITNLLNSTEIAAVFLDRSLRIRRFSSPAAKLLNLMPGDEGRSISNFSFNFQDDRLLADARKVLEQVSAEDRHAWTNEGVCYLRRILPYRTAGDQIEGIVITLVDITAEMTAVAESERLAVLLKDSNDAIIMNDLDGRIRIWNRGAEHMYGYSEAEAMQMNIDTLVPADKQKEARSFFSEVAKRGRREPFETRRLTKTGESIDISVTATRLMNDEGKVIGIMATERDITSHKRMEQELRTLNKELEQRIEERTAEAMEKASQLHQREQYLSAVLNTAPDAFITIGGDGTIRSCNPAAEKLLGCTKNDECKINVSRFFPSLSLKKGEDNLVEHFLQNSKPGVIKALREIAGRRRDGTPLLVEMSITKIHHYDLYVAFARDISERKSLEKEVIETSTREQERIGREIHDGLGQRLTALMLMAESSEKRLAAARHAEAVRLGELRRHLQEALAEAQTLSRGLAPVPELKGGLASALGLLIQGIRGSSTINCSLKLSRSVDVKDPALALQMYRIAQEALNNAIKHAKATNIVLEMTARGGRLTLRISDDGRGIAQSERERGGIGLHIMRYRADIIGATLRIESQRGMGTTIHCTVPPAPAKPDLPGFGETSR